ncbi:hypothetical protein NZNM25_07590 [Nitrosopumilus zosterae]|uniref:HTH HARE-type domain-containing protein n=1 Tax=Nitrosopumilus zosterae TaxID=718286 RepID=A0A2S2KR94_9ARCH|nr:HTH domain-containing protein [Nitrosopumilus zosterae]BDQ30599.1 winged helix-turn-helix domain-containing protein [Nitrosopumilus zosterae]GBH33968.1 hypothetical protein NZNM25_07590 [Nitrosopumilus zosterae]
MKKSKNLKIVGVRMSDANDSIHGIVVRILKQSGKPMRVKDITEKVLKIKKIHSKTPMNSVVNKLQTSKHVIRIGHGLYSYKE